MPDERRTARRAILPGVRATFEGATGQQQQADVHNLGRGGLFLQTDSPVPVGKRLALEIHVIGQPAPWSALGRVAWARWLAGDDGPAGMGVKLIDVEDDILAALESLVERLSPLEPPPVIPDAPPSRPRVPGAGTLLTPPALLLQPLLHPGTSAAIDTEPGAATGSYSVEANVAIDLVTRKSDSPLAHIESDLAEDSDDAFPLPRRRWGRWLALALLVAAAAGAYVFRERLLAQWPRIRALATRVEMQGRDRSGPTARA
jgi:uncharacterized protein (TIGR02266 family)